MKRLLCLTLVPLAVAAALGPAAARAAAPGDDRAIAASKAENRHLLSLVQLPQGTTRDKGPAVKAVAQPAEHAATPQLIDQHAYFTLPMAPGETSAWFRRHPPRGLQLQGSGSGSGPGAYDLLLFQDPTSTASFLDPQLLFTFAALGPGRTALRVDAQTIVTLPHTADEQIPRGTTVTLTAMRGSTVVRTRTLPAAPSARVSATLDGLRTAGDGPRSCLADRGFRVRVDAGTRSFLYNPSCFDVAVTVAGVPRRGYDATPALRSLLLGDLGLPGNTY